MNERSPNASRREAFAVLSLELRSALSVLTRIPAAHATSSRSGSAAFGFVGAGLGLLAGGIAVLLGHDLALLGAASAVAVLALGSGALHLDGLADIGDALAAPDSPSAERARRDPAIGAGGASAIALALLVETTALATLPTAGLLAALVVAGSVSRAVPAIAAPWAPRAKQGFGTWFASQSGRGGAAAAFGTSVAIALIAGGLRSWVGWLTGLAAGLAVLALLARRLGPLTGDGYGAAVEVAFAASVMGQAIMR